MISFLQLFFFLFPIVSAVPINPKDGGFDHVIIFGDSLSDNGTGAWDISNFTWPADPHYYGHRFSNGLTYAEDLANLFSAKVTDYAVGGATTNNTLVAGFTGPSSTIPVLSIIDQANSYVSTYSGKSLTKTLFVIYGGANNAFFGLPDISISDSVRDLKNAVGILKGVGGQYFLIPNLPPLGEHYPFSVLTPSYAPLLSTFSLKFRTSLNNYARSDSSVLVADFYTLFKSVLGTPKKYGFDPKEIDVSCLRGVYLEVSGGVTVCQNPERYVWWDEYHPTKVMHGLMAKFAYNAIKQNRW